MSEGPWTLHVLPDGCHGTIAAPIEPGPGDLWLMREDEESYYIIRNCDVIREGDGVRFSSDEMPIYNEVLDP